MDIQSEIRLIQTGPGISVSYIIFSSETISPGDCDALEIGRSGDMFVSTSELYFKNQQDQWMVVAEGDRVYNPKHGGQYCILLLSNTGPRWGYHGDTTFGVTILEAIQQHLERIKRGEVFMAEDDDDLDDEDDEDEDEDGDDRSESEERED